MINLVFFSAKPISEVIIFNKFSRKSLQVLDISEILFCFYLFSINRTLQKWKMLLKGANKKVVKGGGGNQVLPCNYFLIKGWRVVNYCTTREHYKTCTFKRPSIRLFRFRIYKFDPFCMKTPKNPPKRDKLINFKSK